MTSRLRRLALPAAAAALGAALLAAGLTLGRSGSGAVAADLPARPAAGAVAMPSPGTPSPGDPGPADPGSDAAVTPALPASIALPHQQVSAPVVPIGVDDHRGLDLPVDPKQVGWWSGSALPGSPTGAAVLAGHIDSAKLGVGAFAALLRVAIGDPVAVTGADGTVEQYVVTGRATYSKRALPASVFATDGPAGLTLVTCGGPFDAHTGHYLDNVVVTAQPA